MYVYYQKNFQLLPSVLELFAPLLNHQMGGGARLPFYANKTSNLGRFHTNQFHKNT